MPETESSVKEIFRDVVHHAKQVSGAEIVALAIFGPESDSARLVALDGPDETLLQRVLSNLAYGVTLFDFWNTSYLKTANPLLQHVIAEKKPVMVQGVAEAAQNLLPDTFIKLAEEGLQICQTVVFPIVSNGMAGGVLTFAHRREVSAPLFTAMKAFSDLVSLLLENVELRRLAEERIEESETARSTIQSIWQGSPDVVVVTDRDGKITQCNKLLSKISKYDEAELIGMPLFNFFPEEEKIKLREIAQLVLLEGAVRHAEVSITTKEGQSVPLDFSISRFRDPASRTVGFVAMGRDMREMHQLIEDLKSSKEHSEALVRKLQKTQAELEKAQEVLIQRERLAAMGDMAAGIAHEIRNPLTTISMAMQYMGKKLGGKHTLYQFTEAVLSKVGSLDRLTKDLVDFARPHELRLKSQNIHPMISSVLKLAAPRCRKQGVRVIKEWCGVPRALWDHDLMEEVVTNLVTNALDSMPEGGTLRVKTEFHPMEQTVEVRVTDTGPGMPKPDRKIIFRPFFSTKKGGTGLGLSICQKIVSQHGGRISFATRMRGPNKGTTFTTVLPLVVQKNLQEGGGA